MQSAPWFWKWWHPTACAVPTVFAIIKIPAVTVAVTAIMNKMRAFFVTNIEESQIDKFYSQFLAFVLKLNGPKSY